jgi:hypothetical protein
MYTGLHVKYLLYLSDFNATSIFPTDFRKVLIYIKFNESPSSGSRVFPLGRTEMTKLIVAFRSFAKAPDKVKENF